MPSATCCGIWRRPRRGDGADQPTMDTDSVTRIASPTTGSVVARVRPQSARSVRAPRLSTPVRQAAHGMQTTNTTAQGPAQSSPPQPAVDTTAESHPQPNLWSMAMATLSDDERSWIKQATGHPSMPVHNIVDDMIALATEGQQKWGASKAVHPDGRAFCLGDIASNAIVWLNKFKEIGDLIVPYNPAHAALPWAAARFILQAIVVTQEQKAASLSIIEIVARIIHRCQVYEGLYNRKTLDHAAVKSLESVLIELYALVLRALIETNKFLSKGSVAQSFYAILHPAKGVGLLQRLENGEHQVGREIKACEAQRREKTSTRVHEQLCGLLELRTPVLRIDENIKKVLQRIGQQELRELLLWISPIKYRAHHVTVKELRTKNTCGWVLQRPKFGQWVSATSSMVLWLQGFPGSGKTYLMSRIIDEIETTLATKENDESFAFFYCNRNEEDRRNALHVLRSYVRQLSSTHHNSDSIHLEVKQLYQDCSLSGSDWTLGLCQEYLVKLSNLYPRTTLILDALDECRPEERTRLLDFFDSLRKKSSKPVRILISSRPEGDIRQRLDPRSSIEIQATDNEDDIAKFVRQSIEQNGRWRVALQKNQALKDKIITTLLEQSRGMFQWAMLQIKQLLNLRTELQIISRLGKLPKDLKDAYDEIFKDIENLDERSRAVSLGALRWIMCAYRPLTNIELLAAVHVDPEEGIIEPIDTTEADLLDWCANLIRVDSQQWPPVWRVTHLSVVEYLENRWTVPEAHCFVAKASLTLLQETYGGQNGRESELGDIFHPDHRLRIYVRHHWIRHVQTQEHRDADPKLTKLLKAFLGSLENSTLQYREWHRQIVSNNPKAPYTSAFRHVEISEISPDNATIFLACRLSLYAPLCDWWGTISTEIPQLADSGDDLLTLAARAGCKQICNKLCEVGLPVNRLSQSGIYGSALAAAASGGHTETARLLIDKGANVDLLLRTGIYGSALATAASGGHTETARLLIDKGANVDLLLQTGEFGSALAAAASRSRIETARLLIDKGANVNLLPRTGEYGSALAAAASGGHTETARLLIDKGANVNLLPRTGKYGSALAAAAVSCWQPTEIVRLLIDKGANVDLLLQTGKFGSALAAAATVETMIHGEQTEIILLLIDKGANVDLLLQTGEYGSALAAACADGESPIEIAQLLVDNGADVNMVLRTGRYGSALAAACTCAYPDDPIVQLLVDNGADVNMVLRTGHYGSALAAACACTYPDDPTVQLLVDNGADVNMVLRTGHYGSALAAACVGGYIEIVQLLIGNMADINLSLETGRYGNALIAAAFWGRVAIVQFLAINHANMTASPKHGLYKTALEAAHAHISPEDWEALEDYRNEEMLMEDKLKVQRFLRDGLPN